ncbi:MAG: hypothetical protein N7Q72_06360 [Spiroplasma sp. Tabriz.8]|nr:hypothetical protein [Spiroplasma sp. Tabriz.8]
MVRDNPLYMVLPLFIYLFIYLFLVAFSVYFLFIPFECFYELLNWKYCK